MTTSFAPMMTVEQRLQEELKTYCEMVRYMRPAGSKTEKRFIREFIAPLGAKPDTCGNYWLTIGSSEVMWSCHTDTVHRVGGEQDIEIAEWVLAAKRSSCLGADCTTGVWIMRQMILSRVPGIYVFHRQEEIGGLGSHAIAKRRDERLDKIKYAIAFDRKGKDSVITHQMGERCASEAFVRSIVPMLPGEYKSDSGGTFTDTANYTGLIPECTNISVGYYGQHTSNEVQDLAHMVRLAKCMMMFDESQLVAERDPYVVEYDWPARDPIPAANSNVEKILQAWGWEDDVKRHDAQRGGRGKPLDELLDDYDSALAQHYDEQGYEPIDEPRGHWQRKPRTVLDIVKDYPREVADLLEQNGYDVDALMGDMGLWRH